MRFGVENIESLWIVGTSAAKMYVKFYKDHTIIKQNGHYEIKSLGSESQVIATIQESQSY